MRVAGFRTIVAAVALVATAASAHRPEEPPHQSFAIGDFRLESGETILARLAGRTGHYMPPSLLQSQFDALEEPGPDERPITLSVEREPREILEEVVRGLDGPLRA